jgi:signal transduction histidine kinase
MKPARFRLTFAILSALASLLLLTWLLLSLISFKTAENDLYTQKRDAMRLVLSSALSLLPDSLDAGGGMKPDSSFTRFCALLARDPQFAGMVLSDRAGATLYRNGNLADPDEVLLQTATQGVETAQFVQGRRYLAIYLPVESDGRQTGAAKLVFSLSAEHDRLLRSRNLFLAYFVLDFLLLLGLGSWLLSRIVIVPVTRLLAATRRVASGDYSHKVHVPGCAEFADLAESFNAMIGTLNDKQVEVEQHVASLEATNRALVAAREETLRSEKMASVGLLAAGMAHEIGTPLASIIGYATILTDELKGDAAQADYLRRLREDAFRIDRIIHGLLDFARPAEGVRERVDLPELIQSTLDLVQQQGAFKQISVTTDWPEDIPLIRADRNQLQQVFINLFLNARDAMPEGGNLAASICRSPEGITVAIRDSGTGIAPEHLQKIFDPFFTTKEPGKGTGLGLAISARIVEGLGGRISVESVPGGGSCFRVQLPADESGRDVKVERRG